MKMSLHQIRSLAVVKHALCVGLLAVPVSHGIAPQIPGMAPEAAMLPAVITSTEIQQALDILPESGGEVVLPSGTFEIRQPIVLQRDHQTLRGSGDATVLRLADGANCPVIILGEPDRKSTRLNSSHLVIS